MKSSILRATKRTTMWPGLSSMKRMTMNDINWSRISKSCGACHCAKLVFYSKLKPMQRATLVDVDKFIKPKEHSYSAMINHGQEEPRPHVKAAPQSNYSNSAIQNKKVSSPSNLAHAAVATTSSGTPETERKGKCYICDQDQRVRDCPNS